MRRWVLWLLFPLILYACGEEKIANPNTHLRFEDIEKQTDERFQVSLYRVHCEWDSLCPPDSNETYTDRAVRAWYTAHRPFKWISMQGVNPSADTLLMYLDSVNYHGLDKRNFYVTEIRTYLRMFRNLSFNQKFTASKVAARLDFYLTKAYYRYAAGMYFGFVNPDKLYNKLEKKEDSYVRLYDLRSDFCGPAFIGKMDSVIRKGDMGEFLRSVQPSDPRYAQLQRALLGKGGDARKLRLNMERLRWRVAGGSPREKYVLVNIPAQRLWAVNDKKVLTMRVCCGSNDSKTPQLYSEIYRVELNPYWILPRSIIRHGISLSPSYLSRKRMRVIDRRSGKEVSPSSVTKDVLMAEGTPYVVRQDNGEGNSLGRIIFRFKNNFSIFLHDTSDRNAFQNGSRDVSHGCIRVEKPLDLAVFLLPEKDERLVKVFEEAIMKPNPVDAEGRKLPLRSTYQSFKPAVPLFISYFTAYPVPGSGRIQYYPDIYGYDNPLWQRLSRW